MNKELLLEWVPAIIGVFGGGLTVGGLALFLFKRLITKYDEKHYEHEQDFRKMTVANGKVYKEIKTQLGAIVTDIAVIKTYLAQVKNLRLQVAQDHDRIIKVETWNDKYKGDLKAQFGKIRDLEKRFEDVGQIVSELRRLDR